jgi:hypothetical protein
MRCRALTYWITTLTVCGVPLWCSVLSEARHIVPIGRCDWALIVVLQSRAERKLVALLPGACSASRAQLPSVAGETPAIRVKWEPASFSVGAGGLPGLSRATRNGGASCSRRVGDEIIE